MKTTGFHVCPTCGHMEEVPDFSTCIIEKQHRHWEHGCIYLIDFVFVPKLIIHPPMQLEAK